MAPTDHRRRRVDDRPRASRTTFTAEVADRGFIGTKRRGLHRPRQRRPRSVRGDTSQYVPERNSTFHCGADTTTDTINVGSDYEARLDRIAGTECPILAWPSRAHAVIPAFPASTDRSSSARVAVATARSGGADVGEPRLPATRVRPGAAIIPAWSSSPPNSNHDRDPVESGTRRDGRRGCAVSMGRSTSFRRATISPAVVHHERRTRGTEPRAPSRWTGTSASRATSAAAVIWLTGSPSSAAVVVGVLQRQESGAGRWRSRRRAPVDRPASGRSDAPHTDRSGLGARELRRARQLPPVDVRLAL